MTWWSACICDVYSEWLMDANEGILLRAFFECRFEEVSSESVHGLNTSVLLGCA